MTVRGRLDEGLALLRTLPLAAGSERAILNPATGAVLATVADGSPADVDDAVIAATTASRTWGRATPSVRASALLALAAVLEENAEALGQLEALNTGKPLGVALDEMALAADALRFFAGAVRTAQAPAPGGYVDDHTSMIVREPIGVTAGIAPWNYPLMTAMWKIAPTLAAGNSAIVKPSELTPLSLLAFAQLASGTLPDGVLTVITGTGPEVGAALARHPGIGLVSLTGSILAGRAVSAAASETLKRVHLELGGKAPVLVFDDADLEAAVAAVTTMGYWNAGQECGAATRVFVHDALHDDFVGALVDAVSRITIGDPADAEDSELGPLISADHRERVDGMVRRAVEGGARAAYGGTPLDRPGYFYAPTVLTEVAPGSEIDQVEIFGPVVTVRRFDDDEAVIAAANETRYGLSASVWTRDVGRALRTSSDLDFGTVWVNDHLVLATEMPWGGFKESGTGRDLSTLSLDEYVRTKHIMLNTAS